MFNDDAVTVKFGVKKGVVVGLPVRYPPVAGDVGLNVAFGTRLAKLLDIEGAISIDRQAVAGNTGRVKQGAKFGKQLAQMIAVVVVARLRSGTGQGLTLVVGHKQGRGGAGPFAGLVTDGRGPVFWPAYGCHRVERWSNRDAPQISPFFGESF